MTMTMITWCKTLDQLNVLSHVFALVLPGLGGSFAPVNAHGTLHLPGTRVLRGSLYAPHRGSVQRARGQRLGDLTSCSPLPMGIVTLRLIDQYEQMFIAKHIDFPTMQIG
jgi:hypothetical protein